MCNQFFNLSAGTARFPWDGKYLNDEYCAAIKDLVARYNPGECSSKGFSNPKVEGITKLNPEFAVALSKQLRAIGNVTIISAYRSKEGQQCANPSAPDSSHTYGCAVDLGSSKNECDATCQKIKATGGTYGIAIRADATTCKLGSTPGECNHVEPTNYQACKAKQPSGGVVPGPVAGTGTGTGTGTGSTPAKTFGVVTEDYNCTKYQVTGGTKVCIEYTQKKSSGGLFSSLFGGSSGNSSDFGKMMQMMMGMQLGQSLGGSLFGGSNSSGNSSNQGGYNTGYPPVNTSQQPLPTNTTQTPTSGTTAINNLNTALNGSTNGGTVSVNSGDVGQVTTPPSDDDDSGSTSFVSPLSGVAPLTVNAHFSSGTECSDAFDLAWGDGNVDKMIHNPPSGGACTMLARINDIPHTYTQPGVYTVTLKQGPTLTSVRTATVTVNATSTPANDDVPPPTVAGGNTISPTSASVLTDLLGSIGRTIVGIPGYVIGFFGDLFGGTGGSGTATTTPVVTGQDITIGTSTLAQPGDTVSILYDMYIGQVSDSALLDSSAWHDNQPLTFVLGSEDVISGLQVGVNGMRVGGERLLSIPPDLAYGSEPLKNENGYVIVPANSTIIVDVLLVDVKSASSTHP